ncbi:ribonuclease H2 subunit C-like [Ostrea edulis]|uniref:ribonuclease H2 subunit C-like n=1 Tax=Ostrea edulis TaxID=37623 RepID=UPI0024AFF0E9|nr:ribonuclease H2 subunit C-like [Ostrea edulis]
MNLEKLTLESARKDSSVHFFPCEIKYNGEAEVSRYFETSIKKCKEDEKDTCTAVFRGRLLNGKIENVPSGYTGIIMKEPRRPFSEEDERNVTITHNFDKFHYWNLDKKPSADDRYSQMLDWIDLAKTLHSPVGITDSQTSNVSI